MRTSRRRLLLSTLAAALVLLSGTACATSATSAALVGGASIDEQLIFDRTAQVSAQVEQTGRTLSVDQLAYVNRLQTTDAIRSLLLARAAQDLGVVVTDAQVNAAMANPASGSTGSAADPQTFRDQLRLEGVLRAHGTGSLTFTNVTLTIDGARTSSHDAAVQARQAILSVPAGAPLPALDPAAEPLQRTTVDLLTSPSQILDGVLSARPSDVLINQGSDGRYYVIRVVTRSEAPDQVTAAAILGAQDLSAQREVGAIALLQEYAANVGVSVNPRMGFWDPTTLQVIATPTAS